MRLLLGRSEEPPAGDGGALDLPDRRRPAHGHARAPAPSARAADVAAKPDAIAPRAPTLPAGPARTPIPTVHRRR